MRKRLLGLLSGIGVLVFLCDPARSAPIVFNNVIGDRAASVSFDVSGGNLLVTLSNSSSADVLVPAEVLTAVFFDIAGNPTLTPVSAFISPGSAAVNGSAPGGDVGGAWAYADGLIGAPGGATQGIGSAGFGLFGPGDVFPGADPDPGNGPGGMAFGLLSQGDNLATGNSPILTNPFVKHSVSFVFSGLPQGFTLNDLSNIRAQWGTNLTNEPSFELFIPEPTAGAFQAGLLVLLVRRRRRLPA